MAVGVGEIGNDVPCWLVDAPVQPCCGWDNTILAPSSVIGKFVDVMDMNIGWLTPHRFEFRVEIVRQAFDGQKTALVPESIIIGVPCGNGSCGGNQQRANQNLLRMTWCESSSPCLD